MSSLVLDASFTVSLLLEDELDPAGRVATGSIREDGAFVPQVWHYEVRNALLKAQRRGRLPDGGAVERVGALSSLTVVTDQEPDLDATLELALKHQLAFYDALYLELARRRQLPLASLDAALVRAVRAEGLDVIA